MFADQTPNQIPSPEPVLQGNVVRNCHPIGLKARMRAQIKEVKAKGPYEGPKRVLILGASSGFGLASRLSLTFGAGAETLGVSYEKGPSERGLGTAGWYNNIYFREEAEAAGLKAINIIDDAFSDACKTRVLRQLKDMGGEVDLVIYSLAAGRRSYNGQTWYSCLKPTGKPVSGMNMNLETGQLEPESIDPATTEEILSTEKVMGGEDWALWMQALQQAKLLAKGCRTFAFSYEGPELTHDIYHKGTIGQAKSHLHRTASVIDQHMTEAVQGRAQICIAKALVTKASVYIPIMSVYLGLLYQLMKRSGLHEETLQQCERLFRVHYTSEYDQPLMRIDDREMDPKLQAAITREYGKITQENFLAMADYHGIRQELLRQNGFEVEGVDYSASLAPLQLLDLKP